MKSKGGFTILEILVAVGIVALLTTVIVTSFGFIKQRARDSQRASQISDLRKGLDLFLNQTASYPVSVAGICITGSDAVSTALLGQNVLSKAVSDPIFTSDPAFCYEYTSSGDGTAYSLRYFLETSSVQSAGFHTVTN